jgi:3alpha(or 20beta)-hydroxysteroid dehydrogenase
MELAGRVALVTGGARNIGAAISELLVELGASVVVTDIDADEGNALVAQLGTDAKFLRLDVSNAADWHEAIDEVTRTLGPLEILVNNAGIGFARMVALEDTTDDAYQAVVATTQTGTFLGMRAAIQVMRPLGRGAIVNVSSIDALMGVSGQATYTAAKAAVLGMTRAAAVEVAQWGIRVNAVCPGAVSTPRFEAGLDAAPAFRDALMSRVPMARLAQSREIAEAVGFLASDRASFCTGTTLTVDGGCLASTWTNP